MSCANVQHDKATQLWPSMKKPMWEPGTERIERANHSRFMRFVRESTGNTGIQLHTPLYEFSIHRPENSGRR